MIIIPLIINNYTTEEFAVFSILTQFITIYGFLDLGIGSILINEIIYYRSKKYIKIIRTVVFQLIKFLSVLALILLGIFLLINYFFGLELLFKDIDEELLVSLSDNFPLLCGLFFVILPTTLIQKIQFGFLDNSIFHISEIVQKSLQILLIYFLVKYDSSIVDIIFYYYLAILVTNFINILLYFFIIRKDVFRNKKVIKKLYIPSLIKKSIFYFLGSIFFFFSRTIDTYLISIYGSYDILKDYEIIKRPFDIGLTTLMVITSVLWPILAEAHHKKEFKKIKKLLNTTIIGVFLAMILLSLLMVAIGDEILQLWIGDDTISYQTLVYVLAGSVFLLYGVGNVLITYLNSISVFYVQLVVYVILAFIGIPIKIYTLSNYGLSGYLAALIVILALVYVIPMYFISNKKINKNLA
ncbi:lipopolysaccharide biosynthesis protein [Winogradskyella litorisediminis]|uniref:Lipopolysaccharide biosynthesis protein n=1 Tax=Winogradskyella litorisediminis TaxID=1156618 RepID=A0ABW3N7Q4_9FLAO